MYHFFCPVVVYNENTFFIISVTDQLIFSRVPQLDVTEAHCTLLKLLRVDLCKEMIQLNTVTINTGVMAKSISILILFFF